MEVKIWIDELEITQPDPEVTFTGNPKWEDHGIGSYEYWGQKCNDVQWGIDCEDADWDHTLYSDKENEIIENYITKASDELCNIYAKECDNGDHDSGPDEDDFQPLNYMEYDN